MVQWLGPGAFTAVALSGNSDLESCTVQLEEKKEKNIKKNSQV